MRYFILFLSIVALVLSCSCGGRTSESRTNTVTNSSIVITPASPQVPSGGSQQFVATVTGISNTSVVWSVKEGTAGGTIDSTGKYTAPATVGTYHVIAQSQVNASLSVTAAITVFQPGEAKGVYQGRYSSELAFYSIILPDDMFYSIEGKIGPDGVMTNVYRLGSGQGRSVNGDFTASLGFVLVITEFTSTLRAQYVPATSLTGSISNATFTATAVPATQLDFNTPADLSHITGAWNGTFVEDLLGEPATGTLAISSSGEITASECFSGTITPDANQNFFNVTMTVATACYPMTPTISGVAVEMLLPDGITRQLLIVTGQGPFGFAATR